jgi:hypothetical protein
VHPRETYIDVLDRLIATEKEIKLHTHRTNVPKEIVESIWIIFKNAFGQDKEEEETEEDIEKAEEKVGNVSINEKTRKMEICYAVHISKEGSTKIWGNYDKNLLMQTLGICPQCHSFYSLFNFRKMALMEEKKEKHSHRKRFHRHELPLRAIPF